jgi:hypothetical protein
VSGPGSDDDDAAAMLLALGDDGDGSSGSPSLTDVPEGSTVMDLPSPFTVKEQLDADKEKDKDKKPKPPGNTSNAAKEILEKYMRRPRS